MQDLLNKIGRLPYFAILMLYGLTLQTYVVLKRLY